MILVRDLQPAFRSTKRACRFADCQNSERLPFLLRAPQRRLRGRQALKTAGKPCSAASFQCSSKCSCDSLSLTPFAIYRREAQSKRRRVTNLAATVAASTSRSSGASRKTLPDGPQSALLMLPGMLAGCHVLQKYELFSGFTNRSTLNPATRPQKTKRRKASHWCLNSPYESFWVSTRSFAFCRAPGKSVFGTPR